MLFISALLPLLYAVFAVGSPVDRSLFKRAVASDVYDDLLFYFKYAASSYASRCDKPNGNVLVKMIDEPSTDTEGFIARDDNKKEIVIALRGSSSVHDFLMTNTNLVLKPFTAPGTSPPQNTSTHSGFTNCWLSIASNVIPIVQSELSAHPDYALVTTGHSLGGSLASLAAVTLKGNFPDAALRMYTYGQPRTGNPTYASWVNDQVGTSNIFRVVHSSDIIPTVIPQALGYKHHATEYWLNPDPPSPEHTTRCDTSGEDPNCSDGFPIKGIISHTDYFGMLAAAPFCS